MCKLFNKQRAHMLGLLSEACHIVSRKAFQIMEHFHYLAYLHSYIGMYHQTDNRFVHVKKKTNLSLLNFFLVFFSPSNLDFFFWKKKPNFQIWFFLFQKKNQIWIWSFSLMNLDFFWRKLFLIHIGSVFFRKNPNS